MSSTRLRVECLALEPSSRIKGSIRTKRLSVGDGAFIDGEIHMTEDGSALTSSASELAPSYGRKPDVQDAAGDGRGKGSRSGGHAHDPAASNAARD